MSKRKGEPSLAKLIIAISLIAVAAVGVIWFSQWFEQEFIIAEVEASAHENLEEARALAEAGQTEEAAKLIEPILNRLNDPHITPRALMLQAELELQRGNTDGALQQLRVAIDDFQDSPEHAAASLKYARLLEEHNRVEEALPVFERIRDTAPSEFRAPAITALGRQQEREGDLKAAHALYAKALEDAEWGSDAWMEAAKHYGDLNVYYIFSPEPTPESKTYTVAPGDSIASIGNKLNTTQGMLMRANGISDPRRLRVNQTLKYTPKDFEIVIERSTCRLYLLDGNGLFKVYQIGLGKKTSPTTLGNYRIGNKQKDPTWFKPGSEPIPPGDPRNELGTRWMPMVPEEHGLPNDLGIHGTIEPDSIGEYTSMGCPRLHNEEVEELYDLVVRSTPVRVVEKFNPGS